MSTAPNMNGALAKLLAEIRGRDVVVLLNRGNRGDGLAHLGGRKLLAETGVPHREIRESADWQKVRGDVLLVHAGAISRGTSRLSRLVQRIAGRFSEVVVLPGTFDLRESRIRGFAETWDKRYTVFCREMVSFAALKEAGSTPKALLLGHDLSFHVDVGAWASRPATGTTGVFRQDGEAAYGSLPQDLDDYTDASRGTEWEPEPLLDHVARFSEIHTDRAHTAIAAAMMGRRVVFYRNNYFKNRAIYDHSLAARSNVQFVERTPFSLRQFLRVTYWSRIRRDEQRLRNVIPDRAVTAPSN